MKNTITIIFLAVFSVCSFAQDTVFIRKNSLWQSDSIKYTVDTLIFSSGMTRHVLSGTTVLPETHNQQIVKNYGLYLDKVTKTDCQKNANDSKYLPNQITAIVNTDTSLIIDINISENCCYDFLCDVSVDSLGTLNLIPHGYGTYCACSCCFGLTYHFSKVTHHAYEKINNAIILGEVRTMRKIQ